MTVSEFTSEAGQIRAISISCSNQDKNDVPGVNVRCEKHGSLGFYRGGQGKGRVKHAASDFEGLPRLR